MYHGPRIMLCTKEYTLGFHSCFTKLVYSLYFASTAAKCLLAGKSNQEKMLTQKGVTKGTKEKGITKGNQGKRNYKRR